MKTLTRRQDEILDFIIYYWKSMGGSPSYADVANEFNIHTQAVIDHVAALRRKGHLEPKPVVGVSRNFIPAGLRQHIGKFKKNLRPRSLSEVDEAQGFFRPSPDEAKVGKA